MPCAQLPVAMTAPRPVKVMRPINSVYSMRQPHAGRAKGAELSPAQPTTLFTKPPAPKL